MYHITCRQYVPYNFMWLPVYLDGTTMFDCILRF